MDGAELVGLAGLGVAVVSAYFGYVAVRGQIRRRRPAEPAPDPRPISASHPSPEPEPLPAPDGEGGYEVFVSYAPADAGAAERLATRLQDAGIAVFLLRWVEPGLVTCLETEGALTDAAFGVLLFSDATMADLRIRDEYAAVLQRTHAGAFRFVPAKITDAELPQLAAIRAPLDLSEPDSPRYDTGVSRLVEIVLRDRLRRPRRTGA
ncbi:TIR domain-containing protein [Streptomyces sp. NPDC051907]|uniref:toll/interleukin-1 receptor domain-containing protein n=1 Tax=Streptomyces sp. NPDC051907 TaxID=3155284 RepID=UPI00342FD4C9